mgnify:CR=1 FL=1
MKSCNMAVIVPVDKLAGNDEVLRAQVWGKVSELLLPALGKLYRQFNRRMGPQTGSPLWCDPRQAGAGAVSGPVSGWPAGTAGCDGVSSVSHD